jgi:replication factor C small subunit
MGVMAEPLWIDTHAPELEDLPQEELGTYLGRATEGPINLVLYGPPGCGKTAAVRALARDIHDDPDNDLIEINVADFFDMTKKEIASDPRFAGFVTTKRRRNSSKAALINHVLKESASYAPVSGSYKTLVLDNAEAIREDFQQALRRTMERYHEATQFVVATRQPSKLIPAIRSRCFPIPVRAPTREETVEVLARIADREGVPYDDDGLGDVASHADGNLRTAILDAQTVANAEGEITRDAGYDSIREVGPDDRIEEMVESALAGEFTDARSELDDLLVDDGYGGGEVLEGIVRVARTRELIDDAELTRLAGEVDLDLATGTNDRLHVSHLLAELGAD